MTEARKELLCKNEDILFMLGRLSNMDGNTQCLVEFEGKCSKIRRLNYSEDIKGSGNLVFKLKDTWLGVGYSVSEMLELLNSYGNEVVSVEFQASVGSDLTYQLLNISINTNFVGDLTEFCVFHVGVAGKAMFSFREV